MSARSRRFSQQFRSLDKRSVLVLYNGDFKNGVNLDIQPNWTFHDFIHAASERIGMHPIATVVYNSDGEAINDCMMLIDNDFVTLSDGAPFIQPSTLRRSSVNAHSNSTSSVSSSIGGYRVGKLLGKGAFGEVYEGEHLLNGDRTALKFLRKSEILRDLDSLELVSREIQTMKALRHSNIIRLIHDLDSPSHVVLVFELMVGGDLLAYMLNQERPDASTEEERVRLSDDDARLVFQQVVHAMSYAHNQHICHHDLKLENILLKGPSLEVVKIGDFGLSEFYRPGATTKTGAGTLPFLAPEVFRGTSNSGPPLDVWALGVVLFTMLNGRLPFDGQETTPRKSTAGHRSEAVIKEQIMRASYRCSEGLSADSKDLIQRIFRVNPHERIGVSEILSHSWMRSTAAHQRSSTSSKLPGTVVGALDTVACADVKCSSPLPIPTPSTPLLTPAVSADSKSKSNEEVSTSTIMSLPRINPSSKRHSDSFHKDLTKQKSVRTEFTKQTSSKLLSLDMLRIEALAATAAASFAVTSTADKGVVAVLPVLGTPRRNSLNAKMLLATSAPSLDLPREELAPKSFSMKETPAKLTLNKSFLTRLNRNKPSMSDSSGASSRGSQPGDWITLQVEPVANAGSSEDNSHEGSRMLLDRNLSRRDLLNRQQSSKISVTVLTEIGGSSKLPFATNV